MAESFEEQYLGLIIETYEREVMRLGDTRGYKVLASKVMNDISSVTKTVSKTLDSFPGSKYNIEDSSFDATERSSKSVSSDILKRNNINIDSSALNDYLNKCFGCDLRLQWDWQFQPPDGLLDPFSGLLDSILSNLDAFKDVFNTNKRIQQLCSIPSLFNGIPCPQDIIALILAIKLLMNKYISFGIKIKLDWFSLFGPIITALINLLNYLVNFIFDAIGAPLDCLISAMGSGLDLLRLIDSTFATPLIKLGKTETTTNISTETDNTNVSVLGRDYLELSEITTTRVGPNISLQSEISSSVQYKSVGSLENKDLLIPTNSMVGFNLAKLHSNIGNSNSSWLDLSLAEQIIAAIVEARDYLAYYRAKMLETIDALNGLVSNTKLIDIQNMSILIALADITSMLSQLLSVDLKTLCSDNDPVTLNTFVKTFVQTTDDSIVVDIQMKEGSMVANIIGIDSSSEIKLKSCSSANTNEEIKQVENILAEIERLTNHG